MRRAGAGRWLGVLVLLAGSGCSGGLVTVRGVVTADGTPVPDATVSFVPTFEGGRPAHGKTDSQGRFELMSVEPGDGVRRGEYRVVITPPLSKFPRQGPVQPKGQVEELSPAEKLIPMSYRDAQTTPLRQSVPADGEIKLQLKNDD